MSVAELLSLERVPSVVTYLGLALVVKALLTVVLTVLKGAYVWLLRGRRKLTKYGQWAVVTGATDGIGKEYAKELARSGLNIVLVSRTQAKLEAVAKEITDKSKVEVKTLAIDFSKPSTGIYARLQTELAGLDIGVLVNNVGISYEYPEYYLDVPATRLDELIDLNILSVTRMTSIVLPGMNERRRGAIINISSGSALRPTPLLSVYAATKAYVDFFTAGLAREYQGKVFFQSVTPYFVESAMSKMKASLTVPKASVFARSAVNQIGYEHQTMGYMWHAVMKTVMDLLPGAFLDEQVFGLHKTIRAKALKKIARAEAEKAKAK